MFTDAVNNVPVEWTLGFFLTHLLEEKARSSPSVVVFGEFFGNVALFIGLSAIAGILLCLVTRWRRPQLKTIYDLEKGRYFTTAARGRWFTIWAVLPINVFYPLSARLIGHLPFQVLVVCCVAWLSHSRKWSKGVYICESPMHVFEDFKRLISEKTTHFLPCRSLGSFLKNIAKHG